MRPYLRLSPMPNKLSWNSKLVTVGLPVLVVAALLAWALFYR